MSGLKSVLTSSSKRTDMNNHQGRLIKIVFLLIIALIHVSAAAQQKSSETKPEAKSSTYEAELAEARRAIDEGNATAVKAWAKGDAELILSAFADDALELRPDGTVVRGRQQILELMKASMRRLGPGVELTVKTTGVWLDGDTAYETGKSVYKYTDKGQPKTFETLYLTIWKKQKDGTWKLFADMPVKKD